MTALSLPRRPWPIWRTRQLPLQAALSLPVPGCVWKKSRKIGDIEMTNERKRELQRQCSKFRNDLIDLLTASRPAIPAVPCHTEILTSLILNHESKILRWRKGSPDSVKKATRHPCCTCAGGERLFPKEELKTLRQMDSMLQGHPCVHKTPGVELSTGPLGWDFPPAWAWPWQTGLRDWMPILCGHGRR